MIDSFHSFPAKVVSVQGIHEKMLLWDGGCSIAVDQDLVDYRTDHLNRYTVTE